MRIKAFILCLFITCTYSLSLAQEFVEGAHTFSSKKEAYFTLKDGREITGFIDHIKRKKGLIQEIRIKTADDNKQTFLAKDIDHMYLPPSGFDVVVRKLDRASDATRWDKDSDINEGYIQEGYVLFESAEFMIKKKKIMVLAQLVNPGFAGQIRVYFDPYARQTGSVSVGGINVAGGIDKSYYVSTDMGSAWLLKKKDYKKMQDSLYKGCRKINKAFDMKMKWDDLAKHIYFYSTECHEG